MANLPIVFDCIKLLRVQLSANVKPSVRALSTRQLYYSQFGDPLRVIKYREKYVPDLGVTDVLVKMLAAPVNPVDMNIIQGRTPFVPCLPTIAGDEGVGEVAEIGRLVSRVQIGQRVVISSRLRGTWQCFGVYDERDVHVISNLVPLPEASMLAIAPCMAYRMIKDYHPVVYGQTIIQNGANNTCGQSVIQLCKAWGINTINIVSSMQNFYAVKEHLYSIGASCVLSVEEAERMKNEFDTSMDRPVLGINCLGGRDEDILLKFLDSNSTVVYYGCAYDMPFEKQCIRPDVSFKRFNLNHWEMTASNDLKNTTLNDITQLMVTGKFKAPLYETVELKNYTFAFKNTVSCEAYGTTNYVFDLTLPF